MILDKLASQQSKPTVMSANVPKVSWGIQGEEQRRLQRRNFPVLAGHRWTTWRHKLEVDRLHYFDGHPQGEVRITRAYLEKDKDALSADLDVSQESTSHE